MQVHTHTNTYTHTHVERQKEREREREREGESVCARVRELESLFQCGVAVLFDVFSREKEPE